MRILTAVTEAPPLRSGVAEVASQLRDRLPQLGHTVDLYTVGDAGRVQFGEVRLTGAVRQWRGLRRRLADYELLHLHGPAPTFSEVVLAIWRSLPRAARPALVYTHHCPIDLGRARPLCAVYNGAHRSLIRGADHVVVSTESYRAIMSRGGVAPISVIPFGGAALAAPEPRDRAERFTVAFVGQLRPYKGVHVLLEAANLLPDVVFEIAGAGPSERGLRAQAHRLRLRNVRWMGAVSNHEREAMLRRAHVIALPSTTRAEAFGIVLVEGMRLGAVPVASSLPGVSDVVGDRGLLCRPRDPLSLVQAICYLRDDPRTWSGLSERAQQGAAAFTWHESAFAYNRVYHDALLGRQLSRGARPDRLLDQVRQGMLADRASVLIPDRGGRHLRLALSVGAELPPAARGSRVVSRGGWAGRTLADGRPAIVSGPASPHPDGEPIHSGMCVPVALGEGPPVGVMTFSRLRRRRSFDQQELAWASNEGRRLAVTLAASVAGP
ncbi:MAG TPA: glycosyltransferase [Candidatus Micrarchaeia archaeon]|nr:glycosyltransferase [Candidatus Micrarchaeia archaeon]